MKTGKFFKLRILVPEKSAATVTDVWLTDCQLERDLSPINHYPDR